MEFGCLFKQQKVLLVERMKLTSIQHRAGTPISVAIREIVPHVKLYLETVTNSRHFPNLLQFNAFEVLSQCKTMKDWLTASIPNAIQGCCLITYSEKKEKNLSFISVVHVLSYPTPIQMVGRVATAQGLKRDIISCRTTTGVSKYVKSKCVRGHMIVLRIAYSQRV